MQYYVYNSSFYAQKKFHYMIIKTNSRLDWRDNQNKCIWIYINKNGFHQINRCIGRIKYDVPTFAQSYALLFIKFIIEFYNQDLRKI